MKVIVLLAMILTCFTAAGQRKTVRAEVSGIVLDSASRKPLRTASVSLLTQRDSAYVTATITDGDGRFQFKSIAEGKYRLLVTFVGYRNKSVAFNLSGSNSRILDTLRMSEQGTNLQEVVIRQEAPPVSIRQDTIEFNAGSFKTEQNAQLEALLKKLPGVEVTRDGNITANGQAVNKVLVDGKPFFGNDPKIATRNLPADIVDKVQLFDQSSDQSQFSGMDDGNRERTINITIKKDKGKGYFGQNSIGAGRNTESNDVRYQGKLSLNRFNNNNNGGPGKQLSLIGEANNLNQQNFTIGAGATPGGPVFVGMQGGGQENNAPANITEVCAGGFNYRTEGNRVKFGRRAELAASYFVNQAITTTDQQSLRENVLPGGSIFTGRQTFNLNKILTHRINGRFDFQLDSLTTLRVTPNISLQNINSDNRNNSISYTAKGILNSGNNRYEFNAENLSGYNNLVLMRKFRKEGRTLSANLNTVWTEGNDLAFNLAENIFPDSSGVADTSRIDQRNRQISSSLQNNLNISLTEPLSLTRKFEFRYGLISILNRQSRAVFDKNQESEKYALPDSLLSNRFAGSFTAHRAGTTLQTRRLRYNYTFGIDFQASAQHADNLTTHSSIIKNYLHLLPNALLSYTFPGNRQLRLQYRTRIAPPTVTQLQPVADNSNPLDIRLGNPSLRPEFYNNITLTYQSSASSGEKSLFVFAGLNQSASRISNATSISPEGLRTYRPVNTNGYAAFNGFAAWSRRINPLGLTFTLNSTLNLARNKSLINERVNLAKTLLAAEGIRIQSNHSGIIDFGVSGRISYQQARYSLVPQQNTKYWSQYATADVHVQLPGKILISCDVTYNGTTGRAEGFNQQFALWNASVSKHFLKGDQGEVKLQIFDILNQNRSLVRNATDTYVEDLQSVVLRRYFIVGFIYNLRRFGV